MSQEDVMVEENTSYTSISIPVRLFVSYRYLSGDLDTSWSSSDPVEAIRVHRWIQKSRPSSWRHEVAVSRTVEADGMTLTVNGRMDGIYHCDGHVIVDEIKTVRGDLAEAAASENQMHWAQAACYAAMYSHAHELSDVTVRLTYCHIENREMKTVERRYAATELNAFFDDCVTSYLKWAKASLSWRKMRDDSASGLSFPYVNYRNGQRRMAGEVYRTIRDGGQLLAQAPTGIGKTMAVLFSAVKAFPAGTFDKIFYLTARTTGKTVAEDTLSILRQKGMRIKSLTITAKEKICFQEEQECTPESCPYARGHFDRVNDALWEALDHDSLTMDRIVELALNHRVCPFEFSLDAALLMDCIIGDYNYVFDPRVNLRRFFEDAGGIVLLVDEAHNIVDRAREMYSAAIAKQPLLDMRRKVRALAPVYESLGKLNRRLLNQRAGFADGTDTRVEYALPEKIIIAIQGFMDACKNWFAGGGDAPFAGDLRELYYTMNDFLRIVQVYDENFTTIYRKSGRDLHVKLFCLDPSRLLRNTLSVVNAAVFFSATLSPMPYYRELAGLDDDAGQLILPSPFDAENLGVFVTSRISTQFRDRERTKDEVVRIVHDFITVRRGNYLVFFPSYVYLDMVFSSLTSLDPDFDIIIQKPAMSEQDRLAFLDRFSHDNVRTLAGFAVMGGVFGEGIDLVGERLTGAAVVGVGLPGLSLERDLIRNCYDGRGADGFDYAYRFPGMIRVLQAAGRVIRSETDRGVVLLIDRRFAQNSYRRLMPNEWRPENIVNSNEMPVQLDDFWQNTIVTNNDSENGGHEC